jgi:acyl-[acyl-carrier-protein]-phospholipid O-acyltransferase/long-chain-fatty-acid--[acyl-carrier-protein] ligase
MQLDSLSLQKLKYSLFLKRRFVPIFLATFLGAFNDNLLRSGLVVLIAYGSARGIALPARPEILVTICSGLLMAPLLIFSSITGTLADKYEKSRLVRIAKMAEILIMAAAYYGFATQNIILLMCLLFISGTHTAFYSPIKFSILPDHLKSGELLAANGFMAGGSYLAILLGLITGGLLVEMPGDIIGVMAMAVAALGLFAGFFILPSDIAHPESRLRFNIWHGTIEIVTHACRDKTVLLSILALSWFLLIGSVFMTQFANYAQGVIHGNYQVYILFLTVFSIGIAIGSLLCDTLLKGQVSPKLTPISALGVSCFTLLMVIATPSAPAPAMLITASEFLSVPQHWLLLSAILMVAVCGGLYLVPLYAMLQEHTPGQYRSRIMAASSLSDSIFMTTAALVCAVLLSWGFGIRDLFVLVAILNLPVVWYARKVIA